MLFKKKPTDPYLSLILYFLTFFAMKLVGLNGVFFILFKNYFAIESLHQTFLKLNSLQLKLKCTKVWCFIRIFNLKSFSSRLLNCKEIRIN